jgi:carbon monoxide dehydrogenase subunit G
MGTLFTERSILPTIVDLLVNKSTRENPKPPGNASHSGARRRKIRMELTGDIVIAAARARVWAALNDPVVLAACIPGCEAVEAVGPLEKTARVMIKVGPVRARFAGRIVLADVIEAERCSMSFEGSGGAAGMARGQSQVQLSDENGPGGAHTRLRYTVQASVAGRLGQVGGRMIDAAAKQMADQFFGAFQAHLAPVEAGVGAQGDQGDQGDQVDGAAQASTPDQALAQPATVQAPSTERLQRPADSTHSEWLRIKWFALGALATALGVWIGARL